MNTTPAIKVLDPVSLTRLNALHPKLRKEAVALYGKACAVLTGRATVRIVQGYRTFEEQAALYAQGRTKPGSIVTNAKPGSSFHNYGLAIDFCLLIDGKEISWDINKDWDGDGAADWREVVKVFTDAGWEWGGAWSSLKDYPHLEKNYGKTWQQLLALHNAGKTDPAGYVIL